MLSTTWSHWNICRTCMPLPLEYCRLIASSSAFPVPFPFRPIQLSALPAPLCLFSFLFFSFPTLFFFFGWFSARMPLPNGPAGHHVLDNREEYNNSPSRYVSSRYAPPYVRVMNYYRISLIPSLDFQCYASYLAPACLTRGSSPLNKRRLWAAVDTHS